MFGGTGGETQVSMKRWGSWGKAGVLHRWLQNDTSIEIGFSLQRSGVTKC